ncbi:hypothetical protein EVAR_39274_1 [Eumeta japonica]|uniref:Uncharacterized protein n=1 Tax=Eumeta variegata TaxID=151549 RepID=A0A4C1VZF0_EUMVA|nr:hypothetical protein EVAR_39274_1 [Eumeta japonica]
MRFLSNERYEANGIGRDAGGSAPRAPSAGRGPVLSPAGGDRRSRLKGERKAQGKPDCWRGDACRSDGSPRHTMVYI